MQHQVTKVKFGRNTNQRKALIRSLLRELILNGYIVTSLEKAKWVKKEIDKVITAAKKDKINSAMLVMKILNSQDATKKLMSVVQNLSKRNSGYTRILKLGNRAGDDSNLGKIELIFDADNNKSEKVEKEQVKKEKETPVTEVKSEEKPKVKRGRKPKVNKV